MLRKLAILCVSIALAGCSLRRPVAQATPSVTSVAIPSATVAGSQQQPDEQPLALLPEGRAALESMQDLTTYQIELVVEPQTHRFKGTAQVEVTNRQDQPFEALYFRLLPNGHKSYGNGALEVSQVSVGGRPVSTALSLEDTVLQVQLAEPLQPGETVSVRLDFGGTIPQDYGGEETGGYGIYNQSQGVIALANCYPILAVYKDGAWKLEPVSQIGDSVFSETALYTVQVTAPSDWRLAATGVEVESVPDGDQLRHRFASGPARDFMLVMSASFQVASREAGGVRLNAYTLPGIEPQAGEIALRVAGDALQAFNQDFGPYPLTELDVVAAPMKYALGVEYPGLVLIAANLYGDPNNQTFVGTIAHEVAHQWWYNLVGNDVYQEPWLDEALATYSTALYYETGVGKGAYGGYLEYLQTRYDGLIADGLDNVVTQPLMYFEGLDNPRVYGSVAYTKGALFYDALRDKIGDAAFFSALQTYFQAHLFGVATTQDLLAAFQQASDQPLDAFFQEWLYTAK